MPPYDRYPAVDEKYEFPVQVLQAIAKSAPITGEFYKKSEIDTRLAAVLDPTDLDLENLNDVTEDGFYVQTSSTKATTDLNYPAGVAGMLEVTSRPGDFVVYQRYTTYLGRDVYWRAKYATTWYPWEAGVTAAELDAALDGKADKSHEHDASEIRELEAFVSTRLKNITSHTETMEVLDQKYSRSISVKEFGAVGDGVADDTTALQATIDSASSSGLPVFIPGGRYRITSTLNIPSYTTLQGVGAATVIDIKGLGAALGSGKTAMQATGTLGLDEMLSEAVVKGSKTAVLGNDSFDLSIGDYVILSSDDLFANTKVLKRGEVKRVERIDSTTITFEDHTLDAYTTNAKIQKMEPVKSISLFDLVVEGTNIDNMERGLFITYGVDIRVSGCTFNYTDWNSVNLRSVTNFKVTENTFNNVKWVSNEPNYYGLVVENASSHGTFSGNYGTLCRHLFTTGYTMTIPGVTRFVVVEGNVDSYSQSASYDTHDGSEFITFKGNVSAYSLNGGINTEGRETHIEGNQIIGFSTIGITLRANAENITIQGNRISTTVDAARYAISISQTYDLNRPSHVDVSGNIIDGPMTYAIYISRSDVISITNNDIRGFWESHLIRIESAERLRVVGNSGGSSEVASFLYLKDFKNLIMANNDVGATRFAIRMDESTPGFNENSLVIGNDFTRVSDSRVLYNLSGSRKIISNLGVEDSVVV